MWAQVKNKKCKHPVFQVLILKHVADSQLSGLIFLQLQGPSCLEASCQFQVLWANVHIHGRNLNFLGLHHQLSWNWWLKKTTEIYFFMVLESEVWNQNVGKMMLPLKPPGKDPSLFPPCLGGSQQSFVLLDLLQRLSSLFLHHHLGFFLVSPVSLYPDLPTPFLFRQTTVMDLGLT